MQPLVSRLWPHGSHRAALCTCGWMQPGSIQSPQFIPFCIVKQYFQSFQEEKTCHDSEEGKLLVVPRLEIPSDGEESVFFARGAVMSWEGGTRVPAHTW